MAALGRQERIPVGLAHAFLDRAMSAADPAVGLRAGASCEYGDCGALDYAIQVAANVKEALSTLSRYIVIINGDLRVAVQIRDEKVQLILHSGLAHPAAEDMLMAALFTVHMRRLLPDNAKVACYFLQSHPTHEEHRSVFAGAQLYFGAPMRGFAFDTSLLDRPLPNADPKLYRVLLRQLDRDLQELPEATTCAELLQHLWARESPLKSTTMPIAAGAVGMSGRTLARRLAAENVTFGELLDRVRHSRALELLRDDMRSLEEIAVALGFSKASAFQRAFRRWTGHPPSELRKQLAS